MACFAVLFKLEMGGISAVLIAPLGFFQLEGDQAPYARHRLSGDYHHVFFRLRRFVQCCKYVRVFFDLSQNSHA
jgi:hypothetical protein